MNIAIITYTDMILAKKNVHWYEPTKITYTDMNLAKIRYTV